MPDCHLPLEADVAPVRHPFTASVRAERRQGAMAVLDSTAVDDQSLEVHPPKEAA
jgi:hypothetical protein